MPKQQYDDVRFAELYERKLSSFARQVGPVLFTVAAARSDLPEKPQILDACCGTGEFADWLSSNGNPVTAFDISDAMLDVAKRKLRSKIDSGAVQLFSADVVHLELRREFDLIFATYNSLNHLADELTLAQAFASLFKHCAPGGVLAYDFNTRIGLEQWNNVILSEDADSSCFIRGVFDKSNRQAHTKITGFLRRGDGSFDRCEGVFHNLALPCSRLLELMTEAGWSRVQFHSLSQPMQTVEDPEREPVVLVSAIRARS
ncbi:MAG: hypothetical protein QOD64_2397 [Verrucomicrobiota bacterium]|jgi:SAM-dependent methyltransferase